MQICTCAYYKCSLFDGHLIAGGMSATSTALMQHQPIWLQIEGETLYAEDRKILLSTEWLNDRIINATQKLLKKQSSLRGFQCTLYGQKMVKYNRIHRTKIFVQVIHVKDTHWLTVSNVGCDASTVTIYDSLPATVGDRLQKHVCHFWKCEGKQATFQVANIRRQPNVFDCGLFALASATDLAYGNDPIRYEVGRMRPYLIKCLENGRMDPFPWTERRIPHRNRLFMIEQQLLYCIRHMPNDKDLEMICCDKCGQWYHSMCVGVHTSKCTAADKWFCGQVCCGKLK